jgi:hypothetical protein
MAISEMNISQKAMGLSAANGYSTFMENILVIAVGIIITTLKMVSVFKAPMSPEVELS